MAYSTCRPCFPLYMKRKQAETTVTIIKVPKDLKDVIPAEGALGLEEGAALGLKEGAALPVGLEEGAALGLKEGAAPSDATPSTHCASGKHFAQSAALPSASPLHSS